MQILDESGWAIAFKSETGHTIVLTGKNLQEEINNIKEVALSHWFHDEITTAEFVDLMYRCYQICVAR